MGSCNQNLEQKRFHIEEFHDLVFCFIWFVMILVSLALFYDAYQNSLIRLGTFDFRIPDEYNVAIGEVKFQDVINGIAKTQDDNARALTASIISSSQTLMRLNIITALLSFIGFMAQLFLYRRQKRKNEADNRNNEAISCVKNVVAEERKES